MKETTKGWFSGGVQWRKLPKSLVVVYSGENYQSLSLWCTVEKTTKVSRCGVQWRKLSKAVVVVYSGENYQRLSLWFSSGRELPKVLRW